MSDSDLESNIRDICLRLLIRREHSQQELLDKLTIRGYERTEIQKIVDELTLQGWQSDQRFADSYSRYRIKKGYGPIKISHELHQRGINTFDIDACVLDIADDWSEIIKQVYNRKYTDDNRLLNNEWYKRFRFLQQRGFTSEMINTLFKQLNIQIIYS